MMINIKKFQKKLLRFNLKIKKILYFRRLLKQIKNIDGDIIECGVGKGQSLNMLIFLNWLRGRTIYGFDSFEGFPPASVFDIQSRREKNPWRNVNFKEIKNRFPEAIIVKGWFENTLPEYEGTIALLHLDCDLYSSYKTALGELYPKVSSGGIICFDEYKEPKWPGATRAIDEYLNPDEIKKDKCGKYYFIKP